MIHIVFYQPEIAQNTGATIRTAYATNSKLHLIKPFSFELAHPKTKRAAAGHTLQEIAHEIHESFDAFYQKYQDQKIYYISRYGLKNYAKVDYQKAQKLHQDLFFIFGRESTGIPKKILQEHLEDVLRIPMSKQNRSLNLANSVAIIVYEVLRQLDFPSLSLYEVQKGKYFLYDKEQK